MDLEQDYLEYVIEFSLALFAVSAAYFIDLSNMFTLGALLLIPLLFGYTAYISRKEFKYSSFLAFASLMFIPLGAIMAVVAIILSVGNVLVSFFAGGTRFKDYYRATMLPLLFTGLILGGATYGAATYNQGFGNDIRSGIANTVGTQTSTIIDETNLIGGIQQGTSSQIEQISGATVATTQGYVLNRTRNNLSSEDQQVVRQAFFSAEEDVPETMVTVAENTEPQTEDLGISEIVSNSIENLLSGKKTLILVPIITFGMYGLQPVVGLLTAIFAKLTQRIGRPEEDAETAS